MKSRVNWGAIIAGAFIGISSMVFFSLFALATGIGGVNVISSLDSTISVPAAGFAIISAMLSFGLAGYCITSLSGIKNPGPACLHALTGFAVAGAAVPFLFTRTFLVGIPGFAITPPQGMFLSSGVAWTLFLSYSFAAISACAGGVQACYRMGAVGGVTSLHGEEPRRSVA